MQIKKIITNQIRLVKVDEIPFASLSLRMNLEKVAGYFQFSQTDLIQSDQDVPAVVFVGGHVDIEDNRITIISLSIQDRKMILNIEGTSEEANIIFEKTNEFLRIVAQNVANDFLKPVLIAETTEFISILEFNFMQLYSPIMNEFVNDQLLSATEDKFSKSIIFPGSIDINIDYFLKDKRLFDHRITLSRKEFAIAPRAGYPLSDQIFVTKAPVSTSIHINLLKALENKFNN